MEEVKIEIAGYVLLDRCKCCLGDDQLKDLWEEYYEDGRREIYGEMLNECFDLSQITQYHSETEKYAEKICESCICRLRLALEFKQEVLACAQLRFEQFNNSFNVTKKEYDICVEVEGDYLQDMEDIKPPEPDSACSKDQDFVDVEYLELDDDDNNEDKEMDDANSESKSHSSSQADKHWGWPKKKKKVEKMKAYKQYLIADMMKAMESVQSGLHSIKEAAKEFNIPRKTLATKLQMAQKGQDAAEDENLTKMKKKEDHYKFIEEVKKIITYTNAVPFKTNASRYFCTYCSTGGPVFDDADELRAHTRTQHVDNKTRSIEMVLRPQFLNEVIKMDIDSLHCTVCCTIMPAWTDMFRHLEDVHKIELDEAYTKVIPYILKRDLKCALCSENFPNYHHLDSHMNSHYPSYICSECGDPFLSASRLSKHVKVHKTGRFACEACGKIFARDRYRQKHFDHVHKQEHNIKCLYCPEKFYGTFQRHLHMVEKHEEKVRITTCELCGMRFEWRRYYVAHMRRKHNIRTI